MKAIVSDGIVWGIGPTVEAALADVREANVEETAEAVLNGYYSIEDISEAQAEAVINGNTDWNG